MNESSSFEEELLKNANYTKEEQELLLFELLRLQGYSATEAASELVLQTDELFSVRAKYGPDIRRILGLIKTQQRTRERSEEAISVLLQNIYSLRAEHDVD